MALDLSTTLSSPPMAARFATRIVVGILPTPLDITRFTGRHS